MRRRAVMVVAATTTLLSGAAKPAGERLVTGDGIVAATVDGTPARIRIDPAAPGMPLFSRDFAERARLKLKGKWGFSVGYTVGPTSVTARTQVVRMDLGAGPYKQGVGWSERPFATAADGSAGPGALPEPIVRFQLRGARPGERTVAFRAVRTTGPLGLFGRFGTTFAEVEVGGAPMRVRFDPYHARTLATAGAAVRLARLHDGTVSGEPVPTEIFFGVERPVRELTLRRPFALGPLSITALGVRTADYGSSAAIREGDAVPEAADPDEIVVAGKGRKRDVRRDVVSLGADSLARCSSIVFDRQANVIRLTCL